MSPNLDGYEDGKPVPVPCDCGQPADYGKDGAWYCTACWQAMLLAAPALMSALAHLTAH